VVMGEDYGRCIDLQGLLDDLTAAARPATQFRTVSRPRLSGACVVARFQSLDLPMAWTLPVRRDLLLKAARSRGCRAAARAKSPCFGPFAGIPAVLPAKLNASGPADRHQ
jgi:hypothetical protein